MPTSAGKAVRTFDYGASQPHRWSIVTLLFIASMITYLDRASLSFALPVISVDMHLGPTDKGLLLSSFFWSYALMQIPIGLFVDRCSMRWFYVLMFSLWSLACGLTGFAGSLAMLVGLRVLLGIGESIYFPGGSKMVSLLFAPSERGLPAGLFDSGTRVGLVVGGVLLPWLITTFGWRIGFIILGFSSLIWVIPWLGVVPNRLGPPDSALMSASSPRPTLLPTMNRDLLGLCLGFFCFDYFIYLLMTWLPDYLVQVRHLSIMRAGVFSALPYLVFAICQALGGWLGDRLIHRGWDETRTRKGLLAIGFLAGLFLIPAVVASDTHLAVALIVGASLVGLAVGNMMAILQSCAPPDQLGIWAGAENFIGNLAGVLAPLVTGILIHGTGSYVPGFAIASLILVLGIVPYWFVVGRLSTFDPCGEPAGIDKQLQLQVTP